MKNLPLLIGTIVGTLILIFGVGFLFSQSESGDSQMATADLEQIVGQQRNIIEADTKSSSESAQIVITEFSDFECPACASAAPTLKNILAEYPDDVVLNYRHFPLVQIHPYARIAAQASEVAADEGLFREYHDLLFERQDEWSALNSNDAVRERLTAYAAELGIDRATFLERIDSDEISDRVVADIQAGNAIGVNATPTLFVNDQQVSSAPQQLRAAIDAILEGN